MIKFEGLWKLLSERRVSYRMLYELSGISPGRIQAIRKNGYITVRTLEKLCRALKCLPDSIITVEKDDEILKIIQLAQKEKDEKNGTCGNRTYQPQYHGQTTQ